MALWQSRASYEEGPSEKLTIKLVSRIFFKYPQNLDITVTEDCYVFTPARACSYDYGTSRFSSR